mmetsp:Transcript_18202/g.29847  ORF Transcript_18202/g.29847 Transcript_18202/m.29847 type:complete len:515 (+) Transcript_18202:158-1702(+)
MKHCWQLLMLYLLGCVGSNAFAIGGKKGANHLVGITSRSGGGTGGASSSGRRTISRIIFHRGDNDASSSSSTVALQQQTSSYGQSQHNSPTPLIYQGGHICVRLARKSDVPQIQNCNLATLPENYNANFYANHMRQWPELALVAEHIPEGYDLQRDIENNVQEVNNEERITPLREYISKKRQRRGGDSQQRQQQQLPRKEIVGYILGKVEERPVNPIRQIFPQSRVPPLYDEEDTLLQYLDNGANMNGARVFRQNQEQQQQRRRTETLGHVTSIAVHSHARRLGIASSLLEQLHYHLGQCYRAQSVGLHVRISNQAAVKLYCERLGYDVADIIPFYYGDGEDAYFMKKDLLFVGDGLDDDAVVEDRRRSQQSSSSSFVSRDDWINRDARSGGSFFDGRSSMRDSLSPEERAWINSGQGNNRSGGGSIQYNSSSPPRSSIGGHFKRSFQTFLNGGDPSPSPPPQVSRSWERPVWETGPEYLRLPRYTKIRKSTPSERIEDVSARASMEYEQRVAS